MGWESLFSVMLAAAVPMAVPRTWEAGGRYRWSSSAPWLFLCFW